MSVELTVLIPCLNEKATIAECITRASSFIKNKDVDAEIVVVDNNSTDNSVDIARQMGAKVISEPRRGYGAALRTGFEAACGKYIIMGDGDCSYDFGNLDPFLERLNSGYDFVIGNRFKGKIHKNAMPFKNRYIGNPFLSLLAGYLFRIELGDFFCGQRGISKVAYERLKLKSSGMEFAFEMIIEAARNELSICEIPIELHRDGRSDKPRLRPWRDGFQTLKFLISSRLH